MSAHVKKKNHNTSAVRIKNKALPGSISITASLNQIEIPRFSKFCTCVVKKKKKKRC